MKIIVTLGLGFILFYCLFNRQQSNPYKNIYKCFDMKVFLQNHFVSPDGDFIDSPGLASCTGLTISFKIAIRYPKSR